MTRVDERDIMFARMNYKEGTDCYEDYYARNPGKKEQDDKLRALPKMGSEGTAAFNPINSPIVAACFKFLGDIKKYSEGPAGKDQVEVDAELISKMLKSLAKYYNASLVGITEMKEQHYYSHRGRDTETYGQEIKEFHKYGIVFAVEMDKDMAFTAQFLPEAIEVTMGYIEVAVIGMVLSYYIRELGYEARNHMDGNCLVIAPLLARDAGLGEIGRNGLLINNKYGSWVRLGVVTTDIPLVTDGRSCCGILDFCRECGRCARACPGRAIPSGDPEGIEGEERWIINKEKCYERWRVLGTDCGICLTSCPFNDNIPEELLNGLAESKEVRQKILDDYESKHGLRARNTDSPEWLK